MPTRRYKKSRRSTLSKARAVQAFNVIHSKDPMPQTLQTVFPYQTNLVLTTTLGSVGIYAFRGNSMFDPDQTGTGLQPQGYDQLSTFYSRFTVLASKIMVTIANSSTVPVQICIAPTTDTLTTSFNILTTTPKSKYVCLGPSGSGKDVMTLSLYQSTKNQKGKDPVGDPDLSHVPGSNCADQWYWSIISQAMDIATTTYISYSVYVKYYALCSDRKKIPNS